jgi:hypothetical protein
MAIFETAIQQVSTAVGTVSSLIFQPSCTSITTFGPLGSITAGDVLKDVIIQNIGANTIYVGMGSAAVMTSLGMEVKAGGQVTYQGYNVTAGTSIAGNIWANTATLGQTSAALVGLASVVSSV